MADYNFSAIESKWQKYWDDNGTFKAGAPGSKKLYCLDMFPYPSGSGLHVGHPLGYTATDIFCRYRRMNGYSVLHPMGFDAFGLPAEQHAVATGEHPSIITMKNCEIFTRQLKRVGLSYDWDRNLATCTVDYYHWTQWIFLKLFNSYFDEKSEKARPIEELPVPQEVLSQGPRAIEEFRAKHRLAYYADAMVNWCPALGTVLANEEVIDGKSERGGHEVIRKPMKQWLLRITKYSERLIRELDEINWPESIKEQQRNWIGRKTGAEINFAVKGSGVTLAAFTTRPDTLFGVTFFVISPEHPLVEKVTTTTEKASVTAYCQAAKRLSDLQRTIENRQKTGVFTGSYVINPINGDEVPLYIGDYVLMSVGTGAVMGVPAHDERDFEFARTFQIEIRPVIAPVEASPHIRQAVIEGEIAWTDTGEMLPCAAAVFGELRLQGVSNEQAAEKIVAWLCAHRHGRGVVHYKLRDWLFSRQRYWGEPIPIVHWEDGSMTALREEDLPLKLPEVADYKPSETGESPLAKATEWLQVVDAATGKRGKRETNTMPQWAGSCWYYLRFIDPHNSSQGWSPDLERSWMPVDLYVGGAEHAVLHLLYARFWHKVLYDLGYVSTKEPFHKLFNQGMVLANAYKNKRGALVPVDEVDECDDGHARHRPSGEVLERIIAKMSKSLRNVVTLDEVLESFGADTFRMYLMFMGPLDTSRVWDARAITGNFRFLRKVWNLLTADRDSGMRDMCTAAEEPLPVKKALNRTVKKVGEDIENFAFNTAISAMMEFLNAVGTSPMSKESIESFIKILSPFAPHMCEELWERCGHTSSIAFELWPSFDAEMLKEASVSVVVQIEGKKRGSIEVAAEISEAALRDAVVAAMQGTNYPVQPTDQFFTVYAAGTKTPKLVNVVRKSA